MSTNGEAQSPRPMVIRIVAIGMSLFHLYTGLFGTMEAMQQRSLHLLFSMFLIFAAQSFGKDRPGQFWVRAVLIGLTLLSGGYILVLHGVLEGITGGMATYEIILGIIFTTLVLIATQRAIGWAMVIIAMVFIGYAFVGPFLPDAISHRGFGLESTFQQIYLFHEGIFGIPLGVSATFVVLFIIYGGFLEGSGAGQFFIELANAFFGMFRGGPAKVAVVASCLFGTISGSAVANVVGTGSFTIPLMKRVGYSPQFAGAVEAAASTGGQLMPPVMGAAAFIIAEILSINYIDICIAAAIPAVLYYLGIFFMVDLEAVKTGLKGLSRKELPSSMKILKERWFLFASPIVLVYLLAFVHWSPMKSAVWATIVAIAASMVKTHTRMSLGQILTALEKGAMGAVQVALACSCAGIIIGVFTLTGVGSKLSALLINLSMGSTAALLVLTMIASLILGMGLPTVAAYLILAILVAPTLVDMGITPIAAHLFIFYFGIISAVTPPVALAAYAGAGIAGADPIKTGYTAWRLALSGFILPFMFVANPVLLMKGDFHSIILAFISAGLGIYALSAALQGYFLKPTALWERIALFSTAILLIKPGLQTDMIGCAIFFILFVLQGGWSRLTHWRRR